MPTTTNLKTYRAVHLTSAHSPLDVRIFHKECRSLARAGYEVIVLGNHACNQTVDSVKLQGLGTTRGRLQRMTVKMAGMCKAAVEAVADVYHIHDPELLAVGLALRTVGKRVIYDIHEDLPRTMLLKAYIPRFLRKPLMWSVERVENAAARRMSGLIAATPALADRFRPIHPNTTVVNNYVMLDEFIPATRSEWKTRDPAVVYYGGLSEERGIREMLAAMALLPDSLHVKLELGGCFYVKEQEAAFVAEPSWQYVNWHGELDRNGIASLLNKVQVGLVVLHPDKAYLTSQPTKLFEYMAAGIPVVASDFPLWRSIIEDAGCGLLVDPCNVRDIAAAIERLIRNPNEAEAMGLRGRRAAEEHFSWANEEQVLLSFYASLLPEHKVLGAEALMA
ncbi:MAG TPA: glycosyltransferase family 4 protein [Ktedonobacteraceae bacterium]|nr:glycosyltransferase family 4 protein [Ktedonobacteraceae bacterium]